MPGKLRILLGGLCIAGCFGSAKGATIQSTTFLPGPINLTFDDPSETVLPSATVVTDQFQAQGVDFSGIRYNPIGHGDVGTPNTTGNDVGDFASNIQAVNPHFIDFVDPTTGLPQLVSSADFSLASQPATATITALLGGPGGTVVEQFAPHTDLSQTNNIFGFTGILFDTISVTITPDQDAATKDMADLIDNIQFKTPEPASLTIFGLSTIGLLGRRNRRA